MSDHHDIPEPDIHKDDTDDIYLPDDDAYEQDTVPRENDDEEDIAALHASDPPLERGAPEDDSILYRKGKLDDTDGVTATQTLVDGEGMGPTVPHRVSSDDENFEDPDVPFRLPRSDNTPEPKGQVPNKWVTVPSEAQNAQTLPGTGGLDPNPDFNKRSTSNQQTVPGPTMPASPQQQYMRPAPAPQQPRRQQPIPPAPQPQQRAGTARPLPKRRMRRRPNIGCLAIFIGLFVTFCGGLTLVSMIGGVIAYARVGELLNERIDEVDRYAAFQSTFLYDRDGRPLYEIFNEGRRTNVTIEEMPQDLLNATIAIEDDSFYRNIGIDIAATGVAFLQFVGAEPDDQTAGGSTITQQLVRNVLFTPEYRAERSAQRKIEEIFLAIALNGRKSKDEVLELYLNEIYYGNLAYGAQAASQVFFGKDVGELTLGEAAMLAGLPQAPAELDPLNPDPVIQGAVDRRWRQVLNEMVEEQFITPSQRDQALSEGLRFNPQDVPLEAPHFTVYAQGQFAELMQGLGYSVEDIARGGYHVYTTVDLDLNNTAQQIAAAQVAQLAGRNVSNAAVIVIKPITGEIMAMVGSIDYNNDAIDGRVNVTTSPNRQPGSTMKPFTYSAAIELGMTPADVIWDTRVSIEIPGQAAYVPRNYDGAFHGPMRMRYALANSYNIPAVQTMRFVGVDYLLQFMDRLGTVNLGLDPSIYGISLTLGGGSVSPLELTRAYAVFANNGALVDTTAVLCVLDNDENIIYEFEEGCPDKGIHTERSVVRARLEQQVLDPRIAFVISDMLADNNARSAAMGGNSPLNTPGINSSVKTGTTDDVKDNWTIGFTKNVAIGVWVGNNNGDPMRGTSGLEGAAPIWNEVLYAIYNNPELMREFAVSNQLLNDERSALAGVSLRQLCNIRAMRDPAVGCNGGGMSEWLLDYPAGIPAEDGSLYYPPSPARDNNRPPSGSFVQEVEPGVFQTVVFRLAPEVSNAIQFNVGAGQRRPPPPRYCRVPVELVASTPGVQDQWFLAPPRDSNDAVEAEEYANSSGLPFLPTIDCAPELLVAPGFVTGVVAYITAPSANATVSGETPIFGTAQFQEDGRSFYHLQIIGGQWGDWTPLGTAHYSPVVNGHLETLAPLPPGAYRLRLVIIGPDSNHAQQPFEVAITSG